MELDFGELVRECVELARTRHHLQPDACNIRAPANGNAAKVQGDPEELRTAISNLLDNAIKYSGKNVDVSVRVETPDEKRVVLSVSRPRRGNSGRRIEAHLQALLSGARGRSRSHAKGTGLGLFIVRAMARAHGGKVFAESAGRRQGTTVTLELPRSAGMSRILVVEDEAHLAEGLRFNLKEEGHSGGGVGRWRVGGRAALEQAKDQFDAVVLDVMLPGMNGFAVASALRKAKNYVPVLMLTARGRPEDVLEGFAAGADDYLPKPFELPIFLARLQGLLRRSQWLRQPQERSAEPAESERAGKATASGADETTFSFGGKTIDFANLELRANGNVVHLTLMEAKAFAPLGRTARDKPSRASPFWKMSGAYMKIRTRAPLITLSCVCDVTSKRSLRSPCIC